MSGGEPVARVRVQDGDAVFVTVRGGDVSIKQGNDLIRLSCAEARELSADLAECLGVPTSAVSGIVE